MFELKQIIIITFLSTLLTYCLSYDEYYNRFPLRGDRYSGGAVGFRKQKDIPSIILDNTDSEDNRGEIELITEPSDREFVSQLEEKEGSALLYGIQRINKLNQPIEVNEQGDVAVDQTTNIDNQSEKEALEGRDSIQKESSKL